MRFEDMQPRRWHGGQLLAFSGLDGATDFGQDLVARTSPARFGLDIKLPGAASVDFEGELLGITAFGADFFELTTTRGPVAAAFPDCHHLLIRGPCRLTLQGETVAGAQDGGRTLVGTAAHFNRALLREDVAACIARRRHWLKHLPLWERIPAASARACWKALSQMKGQVYAPQGIITHRWTTPDRWPHRSMWLWDSVFHAIGWRHVDPALARDMIAAVFDNQAGDGFIPHQMHPGFASTITQPPVLALGVKLVDDLAADDSWVAALYPKLAAGLEWDLTHRDSDGNGLCEWFIEGNPFCRSGESGMDNSPRFDRATRMDAVDFNSFLALECEIMGGFAARLGLPDAAQKWRDRHASLCAAINRRLWSEKEGFYLDYDVEAQAPSPVLANSGFLPLICGAASPAQAERLAAHLANPETFATAFPVPTIAVRDRERYSKDMWRGPTWINLNWLIIRGLERCGLNGPADLLRGKTIQQVEAAVDQYGTFFEYYDDRLECPPPQLLRKGKCAPDQSPYHQVMYDYGWTATLYLDLLVTRRAQAPSE